MNTPAVPALPCPPKAEDSLSLYLWNLSCSLGRCLPSVFFDMRYGSCLFPKHTLDYNEMRIYPAMNLFEIDINGTTHWKAWTVVH